MAITPDDILLAIIGALIGLLVTLPVTYLVVDRIVEGNEKKKLKPIEHLAKERLGTKLGVGFLTTFLVTLVIDITSAVSEERPIPKDVVQLHISKLKNAQGDIENLIDIYSQVLTIEFIQVAGRIISSIEHLQEDFQFLAEAFPKPPTITLGNHIETVILQTVNLTKQGLETLGANDEQLRALSDWLVQYRRRLSPGRRGDPVLVSGKHQIG